MKSKTFKKETWEKVTIKSRDIKSRKDPFIEAHPWITTQQYRNGIEVRASSSSSSWGGAKVIRYKRSSTEWTGVTSFTGFWFQPTSYNIQANRDSSWAPVIMSHWTVDSAWVDSCVWITTNSSSGTTEMFLVSNAIYIRFNSSSTSYTRADHSAFISDWIQLNFTASVYTVDIIITAYK